MNIKLLVKELTIIMEETIDPCTESELQEVIAGLLNSDSNYFRVGGKYEI